MNTIQVLLILLGAIGIFVVIKGVIDEVKEIPSTERSSWGVFFLCIGYIEAVVSVLSAGVIWMTAGEALPVIPVSGHVWAGAYVLLIGLGSGFFSIGLGKVLLYLRPVFLSRHSK